MHRISQITWVIALIFGVFFAYQAFIVMDQNQPFGTESSFHISQVDSKRGVALKALEDVARSQRANIYKVQSNMTSSFNRNELYAFVGDQAAFARAGSYEYPSFSSLSGSYRIRPAFSLTFQDIRGEYKTNVGGGRLAAILQALSEKGVMAENDGYPPAVGFANFFAFGMAESNSGAFILALLLAIILSLAFSCSRHRKAYALKELHGYGKGRIVGQEVRDLLLFSGKAMGIIFLALTVLLGVANHFHQYWRFLSLLIITWAVLLAVGLLAMAVLSRIFIGGIRIVPVMKNQNSTEINFVVGFATQIVIVALIFGALSGSLVRLNAIQQASQELQAWRKAGLLYATSISTALPQKQMFQDGRAFRQVTDELEIRGQALLAVSHVENNPDAIRTGERSYYSGNYRSLFINDTYLKTNPIHDLTGKKISFSDFRRNQVLLIVPQTFSGDLDALKKNYRADLKDWCQTSEEGAGENKENKGCDPQISLVRAKAGQSYFLYNGTGVGLPAEGQSDNTSRISSLKDPVAAVVNVNSHLIAPEILISYASSSSILFTDPHALSSRLDKADILGDFAGINNAADIVAYSIQLSRREQLMDILGVILGLSVFVMAIAVLVSAYCELKKKQNFVQLIHGYPFGRRHAAIMVTGLLVTVAALVFASFIGHMKGADNAVLAVVILLLQVGMTIGMLDFFESRVHASMIKES